ncbi:hypothetical protein GCM10010124_35670 [Pilimelia terevasa]|uniref:S-adenosyl methyltransferase n=1 Tax=Pilimelia terevasa TaxID=53372 RepID=A0A8J3FKG0_9ACTN|nr:SAM-dependent methyltransferase [Pilimelia terevasa]GGK39889.1 hypothetical protein GCM10010124_35670 [Pilimelia terevasa]
MQTRQQDLETVDPQRPSASRVWDFWLGGSHHFASDRAASAEITRIVPDMPDVARANRAYLRRAVRMVVGAGIHQFLDLGSGIPTEGNVHEVARQVVPGARVVYVDIEPGAVTHSRAILGDDPAAAVVHADLTDAERVLGDEMVRGVLDLARPVCVLLVAAAHFVAHTEVLQRALDRYREAVAPGSYLVLSHASSEGYEDVADEAKRAYSRSTQPIILRSRAEVRELMAGWDLVEPGLTTAAQWRPDPADPVFPDRVAGVIITAVGRRA